MHFRRNRRAATPRRLCARLRITDSAPDTEVNWLRSPLSRAPLSVPTTRSGGADADRRVLLAARSRFRGGRPRQRGRQARLRACSRSPADGDADWWRDVAVDFEDEPSGIASAAFEGGPVVVYDVAGSPLVNRRLAEKVGAKSAVFVPLVSRREGARGARDRDDRRAPGVHEEKSSRCSRRSPPRLRSHSIAPARRARLPRRSSGSGSWRRSGARSAPSSIWTRCSGSPSRRPARRWASAAASSGSANRVADADRAEWDAEGFVPIGAARRSARRCRTSRPANGEPCCRRRPRRRPSWTTPSSAGRRGCSSSTRCAVLATPILVFDRMVGVFGLHRPEPRRVARGRGRACRGRRARSGHRVPRRAAPRGERAAARAADGAPQRGPGRHERAAARDRPAAPRRRGDQAARRRCSRLLPLRLGRARCSAAQPSTGSIPSSSSSSSPPIASIEGRFREPAPHHGLRGIRERDRGSDDVVRRAAAASSGSRRAIRTRRFGQLEPTCSRRSPDLRRSRFGTRRASSRACARPECSEGSTGSPRRLPSRSRSRRPWTPSRRLRARRSEGRSRPC